MFLFVRLKTDPHGAVQSCRQGGYASSEVVVFSHAGLKQLLIFLKVFSIALFTQLLQTELGFPKFIRQFRQAFCDCFNRIVLRCALIRKLHKLLSVPTSFDILHGQEDMPFLSAHAFTERPVNPIDEIIYAHPANILVGVGGMEGL